jgi:hypothetical protein
LRFENSDMINRPLDEAWPTGPTSSMRQDARKQYAQVAEDLARSPGGRVDDAGRMLILGYETRLNCSVTQVDQRHEMAYSVAGLPFRSRLLRLTLEVAPDGTKGHEIDRAGVSTDAEDPRARDRAIDQARANLPPET